MYCPRCGQQAFDEVRFCSRCGLRLDGVTVLLDNDGLVAPPAPEAQASKVSARQKGKREGVQLIFSSIVMFPFAMAIAIWHEIDSPVPLLVPLTIFLAGLTTLLYSVIFEEKQQPSKQRPQQLQGRSLDQNVISPPPPASTTAPRRVKTADMIQTPSVTEGTTNLLDNK
jgi:hypothetical protein